MDDRREHAQRDRDLPNQVVRPVGVEEHAAEPDADEAAHLVAQEHEAVERAHVARAEHRRDQPARQRHGGEPEQPHGYGEDHDRNRRHWDADEDHDHDGPQRVDRRQHIRFREDRAELSRQQRADDVGAADHRHRQHAEAAQLLRRHRRAGAEMLDEVRQMRGDEGDMEAADEETKRQQGVARVAEGLADDLADLRFVDLRRTRRVVRGFQQRDAERDRDQQQRHHDHHHAPIIRGEQPGREQRRQHLTARAERRGVAEILAALLRRRRAADDGEHDPEGGAGDAHADEDAGAHMLRERRRADDRKRHAREVEDQSQPQRSAVAIAVSNHAEKRLRRAPDQILDRQRQREDLDIAAEELVRHRRHRAAEHGSHAEGDRQNRRAGGDDDGHVAGVLVVRRVLGRRGAHRIILPAVRPVTKSRGAGSRLLGRTLCVIAL